MFKSILIPIDVSVPEEAQRLLLAGKNMAQTWGADVHVATVIPNVGMAIVGSYMTEDFENQSRKAVASELAQAVAAAGLQAKQHVLVGTVYDRIIDLAAKIDVGLIVIGAHQPELRDYLLGSNAARVVRHSRQSVMVLRNTP